MIFVFNVKMVLNGSQVKMEQHNYAQIKNVKSKLEIVYLVFHFI